MYSCMLEPGGTVLCFRGIVKILGVPMPGFWKLRMDTATFKVHDSCCLLLKPSAAIGKDICKSRGSLTLPETNN